MKKKNLVKLGFVFLIFALGCKQLEVGVAYAIEEQDQVRDTNITAGEEMFLYRPQGNDENGIETVMISGYMASHNPSHPNLVIPKLNESGQKIVGIDTDSFKSAGLTSVVMPDTIYSIGRQAFEGNALERVQLSSNLTIISESAFFGNKQLQNITLPSTVTTIGALAFSDCGLTRIYIPDSVTTLEMGAFRKNNLTEIRLPATIKKISSGLFWANENLKNIDLPESITRIENDAFRDCGLEQVQLPKNLTWLGTCAFMNNQIEAVSIPGAVRDWGQFAFANNAIETVVVEEGVRVVGSDFMNSLDFGSHIWNHVSSLSLPTSLERIEYYTFAEGGLLYFDLPASVKDLADECFEGQTVTMDYLIGEDQSIVTLPKDMTMAKFAVDTMGVTIDASRHEIRIPKQLDKIAYRYKLGVFNGIERNLTGTLTLGNGKVIVRLLDYDNTVLEEVAVVYQDTLVPSITPTRDGYTFIGWDKSLTNIVKSQDIKAQYKRLPDITAKAQRVQVGHPFDPLINVKAIDADGNVIKDIKVLENTVDISKVGTYFVIVEAVDQWGGKATIQYQVIVEDNYMNRILKDHETGISVQGSFTKDAKLVVEVIPVLAPDLADRMKDKVVLQAYHIYVIGDYIGQLIVRFPLHLMLDDLTIYQETKDGVILALKGVNEDGFIEIVVEELSSFILTSPKLNDKKQTGDSTNLIMPFILFVVSGISLFVIGRRLTKI